MRQRSFVHSLNNAVEGFIHATRHERSMRIHFLFGLAVLLLGVLVHVSRVEWVLLCLTVSFVLVTEMVNTAVEKTVDWVKSSHDPKARLIKDISAGAVLVAVLNALVVGFFVFLRYLYWPFEAVAIKVRHAAWHVTFVATLLVVALVIAGKVFLHKGTPFRGGAVSGHAAVAFACATAVLFAGSNLFSVGIAYALAALVAQSRLRAHIHNGWEIAAGAVLGTGVTAALFQLLR